MKKSNIIGILGLIALVILVPSCGKDFLNTDQTNSVPATLAIANIQNALAAINGIHRALYSRYNNQAEFGQGSIMMNTDVLGEDLVMTAASNNFFIGAYKWNDHRNEASNLTSYVFEFYYRIIRNANTIIAKIDDASALENEKKSIKGQALTYRAWAHFILVQLYGKRFDAQNATNPQLGIALLLNGSTSGQPRATVGETYKQINKDLDDAIAILTTYRPSEHKSHININVAKGIKARVALTQQNWELAAKMATEARAGYSLMSNQQMTQGFNSLDNPEWIWGSGHEIDPDMVFTAFFAYMSCNYNTTNIRNNPKAINNLIYDKMSATDIRRKLWVPNPSASNAITPPGGLYKPYMTQKFLVADIGNTANDIPYMRSAEMILIEAEAKARAGDAIGAQKALFELMSNRDPAYKLSSNNGQALIDEILLNRRIELWGEGFRFTDLKRLNLPLNRKGANHSTSLAQTLDVPAGSDLWQFKISRRELDTNKETVQNP
ncbi:MAG: RagB/SusD family nutrient uptake outer membrane protein [Haliscomenobacter sp.]|uniref:RagB/SusD family nutrient uptake outer membrane protein n=1 Tax=Haliscomenobacter sp. TaxID=2717303 RepID=UPI0029A64DED|nr:RagB/SusD family nutrient uptake outer membrane protein [Haliscomenobacter sp.]MDX2067330.1 RagB/SusD family nutrient uptake outer membrane protein [Haliscomenobacter sp.]